MSYQPEFLRPYKRPPDYIGATWYGYFPVCGQSRDSDCLEESNFAAFQRALDPLNTFFEVGPDDPNGEDEGDEQPTVTVARCSHWAVGWVETLYIHESNLPALKLADSMRARLEDYPVLDEEDFSSREIERAESVWRHCLNVKDRVELIQRYGQGECSVFAARRGDMPLAGDIVSALSR